MAAVARIEPGMGQAAQSGFKYRRTDWTEARIATLRETVPRLGIGSAAILLCVTEPTIRKKVAELGIAIGRKKAFGIERAESLRLLWAEGVSKGLIAAKLEVSTKTLDYWIEKLDLPSRPAYGAGWHQRATLRPTLETERPNKPVLTKPCYYAPECKETVTTVWGGPRMCKACQERIARY